MNRQTLILLVMVLAITARSDTISKQPTTVSPSSVTANFPSTLIAEPQIPSNNKPQPVKGPTVDSIPAVQPAIINNTVESKPPEQISKKEESSTPLNATTTIAEEMSISSPATVFSTNQTGSQQQPAQPITVIDAKGSKGETTVIEKNQKQTSSQDKLQRQAAEEKKARQSLLKSNNTQMVKAQPAATPSVIETPKQIEIVTANISENSNTAQDVHDEKNSLQNKDKKTPENSIVISKEPQQKATEKQNTPQQVIVVDIAKVETTNQTTSQEEDSEDQLLVQNDTEAYQQTTARPQTIKQKTQISNEIKIIPLDNQQEEQTQEEEEEEDEVEQEITTAKEQPKPKYEEKQLTRITQASVVKKDPPSKDNKTVNTKKEPTETQKSIISQQKSAARTQIKKEGVAQPQKEEDTKQQDTKENNNQQKSISVKKQSHEQKQIPKEKEQPSKPKDVTSQSVTKIKEKVAEHYENQVKQTKVNTVSHPKSTKGPQKPATQSPKNDITKSSDAQNNPQEHASNLRRQQQHQKPVIEKDIDEIEAERPKKTEQTKQKASVQKEQPNNANNHQESLKQLLEEVKSDLSNDAKTKIIQHLENQIKQQEASKITILEEKPDIQKNKYLQLQSSSPRQGSKSPEKEEEVSSEEIMDTKTVIVIIILTFIISIPIVREIKSKDSQTKESKNKMENDLKESSQTLGLEFSELDNETGYGEPLDQQQR